MRPKRAEGAPIRELPDGESMVLTPEGDRALVLNAVATAIWHLADGQHTVEQISGFLGEHFADAPPHQIGADVERLLAELIEAGLIRDDSQKDP